jgi:hypothetical protein
MQGKGKGSVSLSFSSEKYDKVYFIPEKVDGVPVFNETRSTVRQFMQLTELDQVDVVVMYKQKVMQQIRF